MVEKYQKHEGYYVNQNSERLYSPNKNGFSQAYLGAHFVSNTATFSQFLFVEQKTRQELFGITSIANAVRWSGSMDFAVGFNVC